MISFFRKPRKLNHNSVISLLEKRKSVKAIWQNKDYDLPVIVTKYLGFFEDVHYVQTKDSNAGIPLDELLF